MAFRVAVISLVLFLISCSPSSVKNGPRIQSYSNLHKIGIAIRDYQAKYGSLPDKMSSLFPEFLSKDERFLFYDSEHHPPANWTPSILDSDSKYVYLGANESGIIAHERKDLWANYHKRPNEVAALYSDFHVQYIATNSVPILTHKPGFPGSRK